MPATSLARHGEVVRMVANELQRPLRQSVAAYLIESVEPLVEMPQRYDLNLWIGHPLEGATYLPS